MPCIEPMIIQRKTKYNVTWDTVPCGDCAFCLKKRRVEWFIRLKEEAKNHLDVSFLTLTYDDEKVPPHGVDKDQIQLFHKKLRKKLKFRYYLIAEYGPVTNRPHYHAIYFGINGRELEKVISETWGNGFITITDVTERRLMYTTKYHVNKGKYPRDKKRPFVLMSTKPALGYSYTQNNEDFHKNNLNHVFYVDSGKKLPLPRYYKEKLYNEHQRKRISYKNMMERIKGEAKEILEAESEGSIQDYFKNKYANNLAFERSYKQKSNFNNTL